MPGVLANSPAEVIGQLLIDLGLGEEVASPSPDWEVHVEGEPDKPDNCITVYDTVGRTNGRDHNIGEMAEHEGIQIRVRSNSPTDGWAKAKAIADKLDKEVGPLTGVSLDANDYTIANVSRTANIIPLRFEKPVSKRRHWVINAVVSLRQS